MLNQKYFTKIFGITFLILINYIFIFFLIYIFSALLLINKITPEIKLIRDYQRNFYQFGGIREIWQSDENCIEYDKELIFVPKKTSCDFNNIEFDTTLKFDDLGRFSNHPSNDNNGIAVLGDSHAMGWGVNDNDTFSAILEKKINRPVYNLAVSGYGTPRELIRLEKSNLISKVNTIIIQYCYNDYGENKDFKINKENIAKEKFDIVGNSNPVSFFKKLRKSFRYSLTIPIDILTNKNQFMDFNSHKNLFESRLKESSILNNKEIIVFYVNGYDMKFFNFPKGKSNNFENLNYYDFDLGEKYTFRVDGHLSAVGHKYVAEELYKILK
tara:strand:- start:749 stop:1729 length:981 start_codon:yes stop_codon:yes gene_type:complete